MMDRYYDELAHANTETINTPTFGETHDLFYKFDKDEEQLFSELRSEGNSRKSERDKRIFDLISGMGDDDKKKYSLVPDPDSLKRIFGQSSPILHKKFYDYDKIAVDNGFLTSDQFNKIDQNNSIKIRKAIEKNKREGGSALASFTGVLASQINPMNAPENYVPLAGWGRVAGVLKKAASFGLESVAIQSAIEPQTHNWKDEIDSPYEVKDSIDNIALAGVFGAGISGVMSGIEHVVKSVKLGITDKKILQDFVDEVKENPFRDDPIAKSKEVVPDEVPDADGTKIPVDTILGKKEKVQFDATGTLGEIKTSDYILDEAMKRDIGDEFATSTYFFDKKDKDYDPQKGLVEIRKTLFDGFGTDYVDKTDFNLLKDINATIKSYDKKDDFSLHDKLNKKFASGLKGKIPDATSAKGKADLDIIKEVEAFQMNLNKGKDIDFPPVPPVEKISPKERIDTIEKDFADELKQSKEVDGEQVDLLEGVKRYELDPVDDPELNIGSYANDYDNVMNFLNSGSKNADKFIKSIESLGTKKGEHYRFIANIGNKFKVGDKVSNKNKLESWSSKERTESFVSRSDKAFDDSGKEVDFERVIFKQSGNFIDTEKTIDEFYGEPMSEFLKRPTDSVIKKIENKTINGKKYKLVTLDNLADDFFEDKLETRLSNTISDDFNEQLNIYSRNLDKMATDVNEFLYSGKNPRFEKSEIELRKEVLEEEFGGSVKPEDDWIFEDRITELLETENTSGQLAEFAEKLSKGLDTVQINKDVKLYRFQDNKSLSELKVGDEHEFKNFLSTSKTTNITFDKSPWSDTNAMIVLNTKKGTKGVDVNYNVKGSDNTHQNEVILQKGQKFTLIKKPYKDTINGREYTVYNMTNSSPKKPILEDKVKKAGDSKGAEDKVSKKDDISLAENKKSDKILELKTIVDDRVVPLNKVIDGIDIEIETYKGLKDCIL